MCYVFAEEAKHATRGSLTDLPAGVSSMVSLVLDPSHDVAALQITGFNPRPRTGSDLIWGDDCQGRSKFGPLRRSKSRPVGEGVAVFVGRLERSLRSPFRAAQA